MHDILWTSERIVFLFHGMLMVAALLFCFKSWNPAYLKTFPIWVFLSLIMEVSTSVWIDTNSKTDMGFFRGKTILNLYLLFDFCYVSFLVFRCIQSGRAKRIIIVLNLIFGVYFISLLVKYGLWSNLIWPVMVAPLLLSIICMAYFRKIQKDPGSGELSKEPAFWIITGMLLMKIVFIPTTFTSGYFLSIHVIPSLGNAIFSINNFTTVIADILFIIGLVCRRPRTI